MAEQLTPADAALLSRVLGHEIEPGLVRTLGPSTLAAIIQAARAEGPHPESGEAGAALAGGELWRIMMALTTGDKDYRITRTLEVISSISERFRDGGEAVHEQVAPPIRDEPISCSPKGEALPVAWRVRAVGDTHWNFWDEDPALDEIIGGGDRSRFAVEPLYARPSPGVSREEVARIIDGCAFNAAEDAINYHKRYPEDGPWFVMSCAGDALHAVQWAYAKADAILALISRGEG